MLKLLSFEEFKEMKRKSYIGFKKNDRFQRNGKRI